MKTKKKKEPQTLRRKREEEQKALTRKEIFSWIRMFVLVVVIVFVTLRFVIINARIPSGSMETTIMTGDRLIGFRFSYWFQDPERGDIVLFAYPLDEKQTYIKRVIGLPGETVDIVDGKIYINGSDIPLTENYLPEEWVWENDGYHLEVPEDCYFVMGDNRNDSADGRVWPEYALMQGLVSTEEEAENYHFVERDEIKGKAIFTYFRHFKLLVNTADK